MDFGQKMKTIRLDKDIELEQLSEKVCVSSSTLESFERGEFVPSVETLLKICHVLEVTPNDLLLDVTFPNRENANCCSTILQAKDRNLSRDEKIMFARAAQAQGQLYSAYLQRKLHIGFEEANEIVAYVRSME